MKDEPLGLALAPGGDIITANGGDGNFVETRLRRLVSRWRAIRWNPAGAGVLFGLAVLHHTGVYFVDDGDNTLRLLH